MLFHVHHFYKQHQAEIWSEITTDLQYQKDSKEK